MATIEAKLDRIESELGGTSSRPGALDRSLECIVDVMNAPEDRIRITSETVRVTQMGLLADDNTSEHCDEVGYTKVDMGDSESAAIRLVAFPIADLQPMERFRPRL